MYFDSIKSKKKSARHALKKTVYLNHFNCINVILKNYTEIA